jgi:cytochrome c oxidase subunit 3
MAEQTHPVTLTEYRKKTSMLRLGLWLFLASDSVVFIGLLIARFNLMGDSRPPLNQLLGLLVTTVLLLSSFFMNRAEIAMGAGNVKGFLRGTMVTIVMGTIFLVGVVGLEWQIALTEFTPSDGVAGGLFYTMTGFHAFHVLTGVLLLFFVWNNARKGLYTQERHFGVEAAAVYWHFVDVVWIFFYPALYLIGSRVIHF